VDEKEYGDEQLIYSMVILQELRKLKESNENGEANEDERN